MGTEPAGKGGGRSENKPAAPSPARIHLRTPTLSFALGFTFYGLILDLQALGSNMAPTRMAKTTSAAAGTVYYL